jgi:hypothetical protein
VRRWSFSAEGYPSVVKLGPADGQTIVARIGAMTIEFNHRPPVDPLLHIVPGDGSLEPGHWTGSTWIVGYTGLKPITTYQVTAVVDYGVSAENVRRQWAFTTEPGPPPDGTPVIWYSLSSPWLGPDQLQRLVAIDWTGTMVGTMYQTPPIQQSPDGSIVATRDGVYLDRTGGPISTASRSTYYGSVLADDSRSVCELRGPTAGADQGEQWVFVGPIEGPSRRVAPAGFMSNVMGARSGFGILVCSVLNDRVVLADFGSNGTTGVRLLALSSGRVLYHRSYTGPPPSLVSSRDGKYLAEQTATYDSQGQVVAAVTVIRRTSDGRVMAQIDKQRVVRFSWDDMRVVTAPFFTGAGPDEIDLVEWQTKKVLWRHAGDQGADVQPVYAMAQPNAPGMAIALGTQPHSGDVDQLWLVGGDGQATQVVSGVFYPAFYVGF